jgi:hypothetical protein
MTLVLVRNIWLVALLVCAIADLIASGAPLRRARATIA